MLRKMVIGVTAAFVIGGILAGTTKVPLPLLELLGFPGNLFMNGLKLLVLPIVIVSMVLSVVNLRGSLQRSKITKITMSLYVFTTILSSLLGTILVSIIQPGKGVRKPSSLDPGDEGPAGGVSSFSPLEALLNVFYNALPSNIFLAASNYNVLGKKQTRTLGRARHQSVFKKT